MRALAEEWRECFAGYYEVSSRGNVRRKRGFTRSGHRYRPCGRLLSPFPSKIHVAVSMSRPGVRRVVNVHRLVAAAFIGRCPGGKEVNHINGNPHDNRAENLEYVTRSENMLHAYRTGLAHGVSCPGARNTNAILSEDDVLKIREARAEGVICRVLARRFNVSRSTIDAAARRVSWRNV